MDPLQISAQFAAYNWYMNVQRGAARSEDRAARFARKHAAAFRSCAHEGLGRLLIRLASGRGRRKRRPTSASCHTAQMA
jgi:hypothetical protein